MIKMAIAERIISGRKRKYSALEGRALASTGELLHGGRSVTIAGRGVYAERHVQSGLIEDGSRNLGDTGQKGLRAGSKPEHHHCQRNHGCPLARGQVRHMAAEVFSGFAVEDTLVEPE